MNTTDKVKRGTDSAPLQSRQTSANIEEWYEVETSRVGADDWFAASGATSDTAEGARKDIQRWVAQGHIPNTFEYRIVRKRLTSEVVA